MGLISGKIVDNPGRKPARGQ